MPEILRYPMGRDEVPWLDGIFVGWNETSAPFSNAYLASPEDSVAILGPPRVGKTSGILIPAAMAWPGPLISASTKPDVLKATRGRRLACAAPVGGDVFVYAPTDRREHIGGARTVRWSPVAGCEDATTCEIRVQKMLGPESEKEDKFFRQAGATVMRGYFHAAALSKCGMRRMKTWIDSMSVDEAIDILEGGSGRSHAAQDYASALRGIAKQPPETRAGTFGTVSERLAGIIGNAAALDNADHGDFDVEEFLGRSSTLYIVSPEDTMTVIAPLVAGLIESIVSRAYRFAVESPRGRLDPPLLLLLDEVGAIAPLQSLPQIMSQGASQGVLCAWAAQSFNQLRARWGEEWARSIWGASSQKLVFGSLADNDLLEQISQLFGEYDRRVSAHGNNKAAVIMAALAKQNTPPHLLRERRVQVSELHTQAPGLASLVAMTPTGPAVQVVGAPPAFTVEPFASCQRAEQAVQQQLEAGVIGGPDTLWAHAVIDAYLRAVDPHERQRFHREQAELQRQLTELAADPGRRAIKLGCDPRLKREEHHLRHFMAQPLQRQARLQVEIVRRFVTGESPSFSYDTGDTPPEQPPRREPETPRPSVPDRPVGRGGPTSPAQRTSPSQPATPGRRSLRREPEPYRMPKQRP